MVQWYTILCTPRSSMIHCMDHHTVCVLHYAALCNGVTPHTLQCSSLITSSLYLPPLVCSVLVSDKALHICVWHVFIARDRAFISSDERVTLQQQTCANTHCMCTYTSVHIQFCYTWLSELRATCLACSIRTCSSLFLFEYLIY